MMMARGAFGCWPCDAGLEGHVGHLHGLLFDADGEDQHVPGHAAVALELVQASVVMGTSPKLASAAVPLRVSGPMTSDVPRRSMPW